MQVTKRAHQYPTQASDLGVQLQSTIGFNFLTGPPPDFHGMGRPWKTTRHKLMRIVRVPPIMRSFTRMLIKNCCILHHPMGALNRGTSSTRTENVRGGYLGSVLQRRNRLSKLHIIWRPWLMFKSTRTM